MSTLYAKWMRSQIPAFRFSKQLFYHVGSDFAWDDADESYELLDQVINYINSNQEHFGIRMVYSTPGNYTDALYKEYSAAQRPPETSYWTGYFWGSKQ